MLIQRQQVSFASKQPQRKGQALKVEKYCVQNKRKIWIGLFLSRIVVQREIAEDLKRNWNKVQIFVQLAKQYSTVDDAASRWRNGASYSRSDARNGSQSYRE